MAWPLPKWPPGEGWTPERIEQLPQLWDSGISAARIAEQLGGGITRNAVLSKANRIGLPPREWSNQYGRAAHRARAATSIAPRPAKMARSPAPTIAAPEPLPASEAHPISLGSVGMVFTHWTVSDPPDVRELGRCAYPMWGDDPDIPPEQRRFCRAPTEAADAPYCRSHAATAYGRQP